MATMHSYLVTMIDRETGKSQRIVVQDTCPHGIQEFVDQKVAEGHPDLYLNNPVVVDVDEQAARHIPIKLGEACT